MIAVEIDRKALRVALVPWVKTEGGNYHSQFQCNMRQGIDLNDLFHYRS